jgi:hypothetical protein
MNRLIRTLGLSALLSGPALAQEPDYMGGFEGRWEGPLKSIEPQAYDAVHGTNLADDMQLAFTVKNDAVSVFSSAAKGDWTEVKPGKFQILPFKTNAVISALDSSNEGPDKQGWVETWNISVTHKDRDHLLVIFTRQVSNYSTPDENHGSTPGRFLSLGVGEMHRVGP